MRAVRAVQSSLLDFIENTRLGSSAFQLARIAFFALVVLVGARTASRQFLAFTFDDILFMGITALAFLLIFWRWEIGIVLVLATTSFIAYYDVMPTLSLYHFIPEIPVLEQLRLYLGQGIMLYLLGLFAISLEARSMRRRLATPLTPLVAIFCLVVLMASLIGLVFQGVSLVRMVEASRSYSFYLMFFVTLLCLRNRRAMNVLMVTAVRDGGDRRHPDVRAVRSRRALQGLPGQLGARRAVRRLCWPYPAARHRAHLDDRAVRDRAHSHLLEPHEPVAHRLARHSARRAAAHLHTQRVDRHAVVHGDHGRAGPRRGAARRAAHVPGARIFVAVLLVALQLVSTDESNYMTPYVKRFTSIFDPESYEEGSSAGARWMEVQAAWPKVVEHPWWGVGVGGTYRWEEAWDDYGQAHFMRPVSYIHNAYFLILTHTGVIGFTTCMAMYVVFFVRARRIFTRLDRPQDRATVMACIGAIGSVLLASIMQPSLWYPPAVPCIGVIFGLMEVTRYFRDREVQEARLTNVRSVVLARRRQAGVLEPASRA
jgi:hypothetical protein